MPTRADTRILLFFLAPPDISELLEAVERRVRIRYFESGSFEKKELRRYRSFRDIQDLGQSTSGKITAGLSLLIAGRWARVRARRVSAVGGTARFVVDQQANPRALVLEPGGVYADRSVVRGTLGANVSNARARRLLSQFENILEESTARVGGYFVGRTAAELHRSGYRLVTIHDAESPDLDLAI